MSRRRKRSRPAQPRQAQAQDAYINTLNRTGLAQPNWMNAIAYPETRTTQMYQLWNGLYRDSWIPAAIVDIPAEDMLKSWITITTELAPEDMDQLDRAIRRGGGDLRLDTENPFAVDQHGRTAQRREGPVRQPQIPEQRLHRVSIR